MVNQKGQRCRRLWAKRGRLYAPLTANNGVKHRYPLDVETIPDAVLAQQALKMKHEVKRVGEFPRWTFHRRENTWATPVIANSSGDVILFEKTSVCRPELPAGSCAATFPIFQRPQTDAKFGSECSTSEAQSPAVSNEQFSQCLTVVVGCRILPYGPDYQTAVRFRNDPLRAFCNHKNIASRTLKSEATEHEITNGTSMV